MFLCLVSLCVCVCVDYWSFFPQNLKPKHYVVISHKSFVQIVLYAPVFSIQTGHQNKNLVMLLFFWNLCQNKTESLRSFFPSVPCTVCTVNGGNQGGVSFGPPKKRFVPVNNLYQWTHIIWKYVIISNENTLQITDAESSVSKFLNTGSPRPFPVYLTVVWSTSNQPAAHTPVPVEVCQRGAGAASGAGGP